LQGTAFLAGSGGDGLGGLALEAGELAREDGEGVVALLFTGEEGEIALGESGEAALAGVDGLGERSASASRAWASGWSRMFMAASERVPPFSIAAASAGGYNHIAQ
jgi:hypothetical protein